MSADRPPVESPTIEESIVSDSGGPAFWSAFMLVGFFSMLLSGILHNVASRIRGGASDGEAIIPVFFALALLAFISFAVRSGRWVKRFDVTLAVWLAALPLVVLAAWEIVAILVFAPQD